MASAESERVAVHPYSKKKNELYSHFAPTRFTTPAYSAACIPFHWMLKETVQGKNGLAETLKLGYEVDREPDLEFTKTWVQERRNQLVLLDTFFSAIRPEESLCFFYAKKTPLSEDSRRVIVGVGRVLAVGGPIEYEYSVQSPQFECVLWERMVTHSIRPDFQDGFLFPYQEILARADADPSLDPEDFIAFAPDAGWEEFSYGSAHVSHDTAIASLLSCAAALHKINEVIDGPWNQVLEWLDGQLNRLWKMRGAFPGFGSSLSAFGLPHGNLVAYEVSKAAPTSNHEAFDPWAVLEQELSTPTGDLPQLNSLLGATFKKALLGLPEDRKSLLRLLSRFAINNDQAKRYYDTSARKETGIQTTDAELLGNPYLLYELDRHQPDRIALEVIDRGLFPAPAIPACHPLTGGSAPSDELDERRVRSAVMYVLEAAANEGHTLLPVDMVIRRVRELPVTPACPLTADTLSILEPFFLPFVRGIPLQEERAYQLDTYATTQERISTSVLKRISGARHNASHHWRELLDAELPAIDPTDMELEEQARTEKVAALAELFASRISVLMGPAGCGKSTLLRVLCTLPEIDRGGVLLLAPTGKARARLEETTNRKGALTLAQFLLKYGRFNGRTQRYLITGSSNREKEFRTVIVDESSMLTEDQLGALLDSLANVERLILVGDPQQLPPIGAGRPFVDIVRKLQLQDRDAKFPRVGPGYAELTIPRRQAGKDREDLRLARWFASETTEATLDEVWDVIESGQSSHVSVIRWSSTEDLHRKLLDTLVRELSLDGPDDETGFETSLGGTLYEGSVYFHSKYKLDEGAAARAEAWQVLSPLRTGQHGIDALNRLIQRRFRVKTKQMANEPHFKRKVPKPCGPQEILYGDKVISVDNGVRWRFFPEQGDAPYIANGDIGIVVGQYKGRAAKYSGPPWELEIEFKATRGTKIKYSFGEFEGDEGLPPLELAYALTVHKTQGSEFGTTFVILPNPCRLLSRELLYTALTRHQGKLVVLHQGDFRDFMRFSHGSYSDIARRFTNLFEMAKPVSFMLERRQAFFDENLIHRTKRGDMVRSKSELVIADALFDNGIEYVYEAELKAADGSRRRPDFTISDSESGRTFYWEHLGLLHDPFYRQNWAAKKAWYEAQGVLSHVEGGGPNGILIVTEDGPHKGLDSAKLTALIKDLLG